MSDSRQEENQDARAEKKNPRQTENREARAETRREKNRKQVRQEAILKIVAEEAIETQEQLSEALRKRGILCTQATISRDIRQLALVKKTADGDGYYHAAKTIETDGGRLEKLEGIFRDSVLSVDCAQNLIVLKTMPGLANAACVTLDRQSIPALVGTIAGDDTAFLAMRDRDAAAAFCEEIRKMLK